MSNIDWTKLVTKEMKQTAITMQVIAQITAEQARLKAIADRVIQPLQDDHDTGDATEADEARLIIWKRYRSALAKVQLQPGYPTEVEWPVTPA